MAARKNAASSTWTTRWNAFFASSKNKDGRADGQIFNIGNPDNEASIAELAQLVLEAFEVHPLRDKFPPFAGFQRVESGTYYGSGGYQDVEHRKPSIKKARKILDWETENRPARIGRDYGRFLLAGSRRIRRFRREIICEYSRGKNAMNASNTDFAEREKEQSAQLDLSHEELQAVETQLSETRKVLNRDWPEMTPRERSSQSRVVKEIEERRRVLLERIEIAEAFSI